MSNEILKAAYADLAAAMARINAAHREGSPGAVVVLLDDGGENFSVLAKGTTGDLSAMLRATCLNHTNLHHIMAGAVVGAVRQRQVMCDEN